MKRLLMAITLGTAALSTPLLAADVGVSVSIGQPGFYGRLDVGGFPAPALLYPQPVMIEPVPVGRPPLYLRVPPGHARHWERHCHEYRACGERVYFVQDNWYNREYAPRYREHRGERWDNERRDGFRDERRDDDHDHWRGEDHRHGHGRDRD